jgi:beta-glucosidase
MKKDRTAGALQTTALIMLAVVVVPMAATAHASSSQASHSRPWMNASQSPSVRARELLSRMTLAEKAGEMTQIDVNRLRGDCKAHNGPLRRKCLHKVLAKDHVGSILAGANDNPVQNTARQWAKQYNAIQHYALSHSRLGIPIIYGVDAVHGFGHPPRATLFPQQIGLGATFDPGLARAIGGQTRRQLQASGAQWDFAPVVGVARDNRWGRYSEDFGESPLLVSALGDAFVKGLQEMRRDDGPLGVAATLKHFAGYSEPLNGHDRRPAQLPLRYLQDIFLPPFQSGIEAGARTVMVEYGAINGIPADSSHYLLTTVLRDRMHFKGVLVSDYGNVRDLLNRYHVASDYPHAIAAAVNAGLDMAMEPLHADEYTHDLIKAVHQHLIPVERVDQAVLRILTLKFELGLFDRPYVDLDKVDPDKVVEGGRALARKAAAASITLLRNHGGVLPLSPKLDKIVVAGPSADSMRNQLGGWSVVWQGVPKDAVDEVPGTTVLDGIKAAVSDSTDVVYARTRRKALAAAQGADAVVVAVGEEPYAEGLGDNPTPKLPSGQQKLIAALEKTGTPVIVVVMDGRPIELGPAAKADALFMAYLPGTEGGAAFADLLFGKVNPRGRLPVTWPKTVGNEPLFFNYLPGSNLDNASYDTLTLYPFGYGLSYTRFETAAPAVTADSPGGRVSVTVKVKNTGDRAGTDIVPIYVSKKVSQPLWWHKRLVGFSRVKLNAGQSKTVTVRFPLSRLARTQGDIDGPGRRIVEPGNYQVTAGDNERESATFKVHAKNAH